MIRSRLLPLLLGLSMLATTESPGAAEAGTGTEEANAATKTEAGKLLPLPIFITEPAIGEGLCAALIYFHSEERQQGPGASIAREARSTRDSIGTIGVGVRYLAIREQDTRVGSDTAEGLEDVTCFIQMGNAWK